MGGYEKCLGFFQLLTPAMQTHAAQACASMLYLSTFCPYVLLKSLIKAGIREPQATRSLLITYLHYRQGQAVVLQVEIWLQAQRKEGEWG